MEQGIVRDNYHSFNAALKWRAKEQKVKIKLEEKKH
jgi:hypothetical protein